MLQSRKSLSQMMWPIQLLIGNGPKGVRPESLSHQSAGKVEKQLIQGPLGACVELLMRRMKVCVDLPIRHQRQPEERPVLLDAKGSLFGNFL
jgi:hypothetical protein